VPADSASVGVATAPAGLPAREAGATPTGPATPDFFIADDSGLEVEALGWGPGVISSRYAGREGDDRANVEKLLVALASVCEETARRARFVCEVTCLTPDGEEVAVRGEWWGRIAAAARGDAGFGYDPVFVPDGFSKTFAEMSLEEKNRLSHRAKALEKLKDFLKLHQ
jgi:XTP/dITP diphosphohydrolase